MPRIKTRKVKTAILYAIVHEAPGEYGRLTIYAGDPGQVDADCRVETLNVEWPEGWTIGPSQGGELTAWDDRSRALRFTLARNRLAVIVFLGDGCKQVRSLRRCRAGLKTLGSPCGPPGFAVVTSEEDRRIQCSNP